MSRPEQEPLSPEERALADRLARLGAHEGPSPALDAKILAAAHAAVAAPTRRRRRWLGLTAVPGGLITGAGMAAALVVVVGVVWQLRPSDPVPQPARSEGDIAYVTGQMIERPQPVVAPPPPPLADAAAPARALNPPPAKRAAVLAQREIAPAPVTDADEAEVAAAPTPAAVATVGPDEGHGRRRLDALAPQAPTVEAYSAPAPAAPALRAASPTSEAALASQEDNARREAFGLSRARQQQRLAEEATATAKADAAAKSSAASNTTLDRIEVTGSRVIDDSSSGSGMSDATLADIPIADDAKLDEKAWLERIRQRRDAGDADAARASLARFRQEHPRTRIPRDLRPLLAAPAR